MDYVWLLEVVVFNDVVEEFDMGVLGDEGWYREYFLVEF